MLILGLKGLLGTYLPLASHGKPEVLIFLFCPFCDLTLQRYKLQRCPVTFSVTDFLCLSRIFFHRGWRTSAGDQSRSCLCLSHGSSTRQKFLVRFFSVTFNHLCFVFPLFSSERATFSFFEVMSPYIDTLKSR